MNARSDGGVGNGLGKGVGVRLADATTHQKEGPYETTKFLSEIGPVKSGFLLIVNTGLIKYEHAFRGRVRAPN
jgi:hypothetical protein